MLTMKDKVIFGISKEQQIFPQPEARQANNAIIKYAAPTNWNQQSDKNSKVIYFIPLAQ